MLWVTPEEKIAIRAKGRTTIDCVHPLAGFPLYDGFNTLGFVPKNRGMTWPEWSRERLIRLLCRHLVDQLRL
jgi:hypothetical protein